MPWTRPAAVLQKLFCGIRKNVWGDEGHSRIQNIHHEILPFLAYLHLLIFLSYLDTKNITLEQCFSTFLGSRHRKETKIILWHSNLPLNDNLKHP